MNSAALLCAILFCIAANAQENDFVGGDIEDIRQRAVTFYEAVSTSDNVLSTVYVELAFSCPGNITSIWFIASENEVDNSVGDYPEFLLWRNNRFAIILQSILHTASVRERQSPPSGGPILNVGSSSRGNISLYNFVLDDPMTFESENRFGIQQRIQSRLEILSLNGGSVRNLWDTGRGFTHSYRLNSDQDRTPLVALEVTNSSCLRGFPSLESLRVYMESIKEEEDTEEDIETVTIPSNTRSYVFPNLRVARDGILEKWIFAADWERMVLNGPISARIEFQIWRDVGGRASLNLSSPLTSLIRSDYPNVYEFTLDTQQPVLAGDYIGIRTQDPTSLTPLWEVGAEEVVAYHLLSQAGGEIDSSDSDGFANPLFAAQIKVNDQALVASPSVMAAGSTLILQPTSTITTSSPLPTFGTSSRPIMNSPTTTESSRRQLTGSPESSEVPTVVGSGTNSRPSSLTVVAVIVAIILLLSVATVALCLFIFCVRRKRQHIRNETIPLESVRKSKSFFDNPVYDNLQRKLSKDSQGYNSIRDPVYLEVSIEQSGNETSNHGDGDSGYAELEVKVTAPALRPGEYSLLTASPSPSNSPYPGNSRSPSPSAARSSTATPTAPHSYHTLEPCPVAEDYLAPFPKTTVSSDNIYTDLERTSTCHDKDQSVSNLDKVPHVYHELEPSITGRYNRLQHNFTGIYVPTQMERRESIESEDIYATIQERLYANISERSFFEERPSYWKPACTAEHLYSQLAQNKYREIQHCQIELQHILGSGNFGQVSKGECRCEEGQVEVAVKTLKSGSSEEEVVRFLQEAAIMGQFSHPNIVQLLGVVTLANEVMIVLEYLSQGDLGTYLVNRRPMSRSSSLPQDTPFLLLKFSRDVASGMEYLERKAFVHRDLAARNILVSEDNHCKIGDFGLTRDLLDENYYVTKGGMIPWRWTAPEALNYKKYSTASDVWSFGCLMYEIWSLGHVPFEAQSPQVVQVILEKGERLAPPPGCPRGIYSLMIDCWHPEHISRPKFLHLLKTLTSSPTQLLSWAHEDSWGAADAIVLGATLETGEKLYPDLQQTYTQKSQ